ncbi:MAG: MFS transporter [Raoultibacter sp.]
MSTQTKRSIFPYLVVATGIACCMGPVAIAISCAGVFFTPVSTALGVGKGVFTIYLTIVCLAMTVALPFEGKIIEKCDIRAVLSTAVVLVGAPIICMSFFNAVWQFYVAGAVVGVGCAFLLFLAVPTLVNRWFRKRVGFYVGLCMAFTGIGGAIFNSVAGVLISGGPDGWRMGYLALGIIAIVIALPFTLFCIRSNPSDIGLKPVGIEEASKDGSVQTLLPTGVSASRAMKSAAFFILAGFALVINLCTALYQFLPSYASSLTQFPDIMALAATLASSAMLGQALGKVLLGLINDRSIYAGLIIASTCGIIGLACMLFVPGSPAVMLAGGFLFGIFYASASVQLPLLTRTIFGIREYSAIYSRVGMVGSLTAAFAAAIWGFLIDATGFNYILIIGIAAAALAFLCGFFALKLGKKLEHTTQ